MNTNRKISNWIPLLSMVVALAGILSGVVIHYMNTQNEIRIKKYEVTFLERRDSYASFVEYFIKTIESVVSQAPLDVVLANYNKVDAAYYRMYPYFDKERDSKSIRTEITRFQLFSEGACLALKQGIMSTDEAWDTLNLYKENIFELLYQELFEELIPG